MSISGTAHELVDNYAPSAVSKHTHRTKLEETVFKATQSKPQPAKQKHVRNILIETWNTTSGSQVFQELFKRPLGGKEIVLFKTLVVIHRVLREGHPNCLDDAWNRKDFLESLQAQFQSSQTSMGAMDGAYLDFIIEKVKFHKKHPDVGGEIQLQKFKEKHKKFNAKNVLVMVKDLLSLHKALISFTQKVFQAQGLAAYRLAGIVVAVTESYFIYQMSEYFLRKLNEIDLEQDDINGMIDQFLQQYPVIRQLYFQASTIPYVTADMTVPTLDEHPPNFDRSAEKKRRAPKKESTKKGLLGGAELLSGAGSDILNSSYGKAPTANTAVFNPFAMVPTPQPDPWAQQQALLQQQQQQQQLAAHLAAQQAAQAQAAQMAAAQAAAEQAALQARLAEQQQRESIAVLKEHIRQLEARLEQLRQQLRDLEAENAKLTAELNSRDSGLASTRQQLEQQFAQQHESFLAQSQQMKQKLQEQEKQFEKDKADLIAQQIGFSKESVDKNLSKFDDPSNAGNRNATGEDILRGVQELKEKYEALYSAISNEGDSVGASRGLATQVSRVLDDVKGTLTKVDDPAIRLQLSEYGRDVGMTCGKMIGYAKDLGKRKPNDSEAKFLGEENVKFSGLVKNIHQTIEESQRRSDSSGDLEDLASRELTAAARVIEEAAAALLRQSEERKLKAPMDGEDIEGSIMEAAMQVTRTTQMLVKSAISAQQERVKEGIAARATGEKYSSNPMWTEGLISAGKGVAEATRQLVIFANKAAQGQVDDAALIAAARAVNKPTAQLLTATHSTNLKSQGALAIQAELDAAASSVTKAATGLVDAAKLHTKKSEQRSLRDSVGLASRVGAEIIQATKVQQLEKDLLEARNVLFAERKKAYAFDGGDSNKSRLRGPSGSGSGLPAFNPTPAPSTSSNSPFLSPSNNTPTFTPPTNTAPFYSSVDTTSNVGNFGNATTDESSVKVPAYMQKLTAERSGVVHAPTFGGGSGGANTGAANPFGSFDSAPSTTPSNNLFGVSTPPPASTSAPLHDIWGNVIPTVPPQQNTHNPFS